MEPVTITTSISSLYTHCMWSFQQLCNLLKDSEFSERISPLALQDQLGRFRVWAGNTGAHRNGRVSLDHRLREAPQIHGVVTRLLNDLNESLKEVIAIVSLERQPFDEVSWPSDSSVSSHEDDGTTEDKINQTTELQERLMGITHFITCLYKLSITIRNPAPRDKLEKCASIHVSHFEEFDIQHVSHKFPNAEKYLIERLGKANSTRRQLLKYYESHHDKVIRYIDLPQSSSNIEKAPSTVNTQTTVSTYVQGQPSATDVCSDSGRSQTSYATSAATSTSRDTDTKLRVPPPPKPDTTLDGDPFECPYCFSLTIVDGSHSWMKHVFRDLQPYVCTFRDCLKPDKLFDSRHDWYKHETEAHRREWFCSACHYAFASKALFRDHLNKKHANLLTEVHLPTIFERCERVITSEQPCPLCDGRYSSYRLRSHLARHMQQLSLFTLPKIPQEIYNDGGSLSAHYLGVDEGKTEESIDSISSTTRRMIEGGLHKEPNDYTQSKIPQEIYDDGEYLGAHDSEVDSGVGKGKTEGSLLDSIPSNLGRKRERIPSSLVDTRQIKYYVCPYQLRDPPTYVFTETPEVCAKGIKPGRIREHLRRHHLKPVQCPNCGRRGDLGQVKEHCERRRCIRRTDIARVPPEILAIDEKLTLLSKVTWERVWELLFGPDVPLPHEDDRFIQPRDIEETIDPFTRSIAPSLMQAFLRSDTFQQLQSTGDYSWVTTSQATDMQRESPEDSRAKSNTPAADESALP